jgi:hypothetical protein
MFGTWTRLNASADEVVPSIQVPAVTSQWEMVPRQCAEMKVPLTDRNGTSHKRMYRDMQIRC